MYGLVPVKTLASVVCQITCISLQSVIGKKVRLMTREIYICILARASWNALVMITKEAKVKLLFWKYNARSLNASGKKLNTKTSFEACLFADASSSAYGECIEMIIRSSETGKNEGYQKCLCDPQEVGLCVSSEVDREIPMNLGVVRSESLL